MTTFRTPALHPASRSILCLVLYLLIIVLSACRPSATTVDASLDPADSPQVARDAQTGRTDARARREREPRPQPVIVQDVVVVTARPDAWPFNDDAAVSTDLDQDGVRDWSAPIELGAGTLPIWLTAHGLADGGVTLDDPTTRVAMRAECPIRPPHLLLVDSSWSINEPSDVARRLLCAKLWGATVDEARALVQEARTLGIPENPEYPRSDRDDAGPEIPALPWSWLEALAARPLPVQLHTMQPPAFTWPTVVVAVSALDASSVNQTDASTTGGTLNTSDAATGDTGAALPPLLAARCAQNGAHAQAVLAPFYPQNQDAGESEEADRPSWDTVRDKLLATIGRCFLTAGGAWAIEATGTSSARNTITGQELDGVDYELVFYDTTGTRVAHGHHGHLSGFQCDHDELEVFGSSDYDHDGRGELLVRMVNYWCGDGDGDNPGPLTIFTTRGPHIRPYANAQSLRRVDRAQDLDGDGLLDLLDDSWLGATACDPAAVGVDEHPVWTFAVHARLDGTFSYNDAVTQRFQRERCARLPRSFAALDDSNLSDLDGEAMLGRGLCARMSGWSVERVQLAILRDLQRAQLRVFASAAVRARSGADVRFACNDFSWLTSVLSRPLPFDQSLSGLLR